MLHALAARNTLGPLAAMEGGAKTLLSAVEWTAIVGCVVDAPNTLRKTAGAGWGSGGAVSTLEIPSGDGYVEWTVTSILDAMAGLNAVNVDASYPDLDFALYTDPAGDRLSVYEQGTRKLLGALGSISIGDVLKVAIEAGAVKYYKNGGLYYTSLVAPVYGAFMDAALYTTGAVISGATIAADNGLVPSGY